MKVELECAEDISLNVNIPDTVTVDSFLEKVRQIEHVIAREPKNKQPLPQNFRHPAEQQESAPKNQDVDARLDHLENSTQKIIDLLDRLNR